MAMSFERSILKGDSQQVGLEGQCITAMLVRPLVDLLENAVPMSINVTEDPPDSVYLYRSFSYSIQFNYPVKIKQKSPRCLISSVSL